MTKNKHLSKQYTFGILLFGLLGLVTNCHAALQNLENGLVNDDTLNITWMQDANLVKTSCDANNALWQAFDLANVVPNADTRTKAEICAANGDMTWNEAEVWIDVLNAELYLGHGDWRLPNTLVPDAACTGMLPGASTGYLCSGSELGNLFYMSLVNPNHNDDGCFGAAPHCLQNTGPFRNMQPSPYWSATTGPVPRFAYNFNAGTGSQVFGFKDSAFSNFHLSVWPVRTGLSPIPPKNVPTLSFWGLGMMSLLLVFVARRKAR